MQVTRLDNRINKSLTSYRSDGDKLRLQRLQVDIRNPPVGPLDHL